MNADFEAFAEELRGIEELRGAPGDDFIASLEFLDDAASEDVVANAFVDAAAWIARQQNRTVRERMEAMGRLLHITQGQLLQLDDPSKLLGWAA
jgi:hypothetical protein